MGAGKGMKPQHGRNLVRERENYTIYEAKKVYKKAIEHGILPYITGTDLTGDWEIDRETWVTLHKEVTGD